MHPATQPTYYTSCCSPVWAVWFPLPVLSGQQHPLLALCILWALLGAVYSLATGSRLRPRVGSAVSTTASSAACPQTASPPPQAQHFCWLQKALKRAFLCQLFSLQVPCSVQSYLSRSQSLQQWSRKHFCTLWMMEHWCRLPRETAESLSLKVFKNHLDAVQGNLL